MKRIALVTTCLLITVLVAKSQDRNATALMKGLIVQPSMVDFTLSANEMGTKKITIMNNTPQAIQLRMYLADWQRDSLGKHTYYGPNTQPYSCTRWIKLEKDFMEVPAGASIPFEVTMRVPDSADFNKDMKWSMLFVEVVKERKVNPDTAVVSQVNPIFRMGVHIYETPPTVKRKEMRMTSFERVPGFIDSSIVYNVAVKNEGDVQLKLKSSLEITNLTTGEKTKLGPNPVPLFPAQKRYISFRIPRELPKGKYSLLAVLDGGDDMPIEAAQGEMELK